MFLILCVKLLRKSRHGKLNVYSDHSSKLLSQPLAPEPTPSIQWNESGMYKVGSDISTGEYFVQTDGMCCIEVASDSTGILDSIVTNDNIFTFSYMTVEDGQYLTVQNGTFKAG